MQKIVQDAVAVSHMERFYGKSFKVLNSSYLKYVG